MLLDGPDWHARTTVADRDAAPELLDKVMHWPAVVRIWLPSWLNDRNTILERIDKAVRSATTSHVEEPSEAPEAEADVATSRLRPKRVDPAPLPVRKHASLGLARPKKSEVQPLRAAPIKVVEPTREITPDPAEFGAPFVPYEPTLIGVKEDIDALSYNRAVQDRLRDALAEIIDFEGPIEEERLARLALQRFGFERASRARKHETLRYLPKGLRPRKSTFGVYYWPDHREPTTWSGYRTTQLSSDRQFAEIAPEEIVNAMRHALDCGEGNTEELLLRSTMARLGYRRRSANIESILNRAAAFGLAEGEHSQDSGLDDELVSERERIPVVQPEIPPREAKDLAYGAVLDQINLWLRRLDDRTMFVLAQSYFGNPPRTMEDLSVELGIALAEICRVESDGRALLLRELADSHAADALLREIRAEIRPAASLDRLISRWPVLGEPVERLAAPLWFVLDTFDDLFEVADGWAVAPTYKIAVDQTTEKLTGLANPFGVVALGELGSMADEFGMEPYELRAWIEACDFEIVNDCVLTHGRTFPDRAAAVLSIIDKPQTLGELNGLLGGHLNPRGLTDRLANDDRFTKAEGQTWALAAWNRSEYALIRAQMSQLVDVSGSVTLNELIGGIRARFGWVTEASIRRYADQPPFETRDGRVRRARRALAAQKRPEDTARLFRTDDSWLFRIRITADHLNGSDVSLPVGLASALGIEHASEAQFHSVLSLQSVRWTGLKPHCSTIRRFLERYGANAGTTVFLSFRDDGHFDVVIPPRQLPDAIGIDRALWLAGRWDAASSGAERALAAAARLPEPADRRQILQAYRDRRDEEIVESLEQAWLG